jgi:[pyruvate, water dikinase]-phosphate phosphotransferase / [pyruvate, water dikinase] kinase
MTARTVYFVSDGTGITAETFGNSILAQFSIKARHVRRPFVDSADKAHAVVAEINEVAVREAQRPIVFATLVDRDVLKIVREHCQGKVMDLHRTAGRRVRHQEQPPRGPLLGRGREQGIPRPHRGHQLLAGP